MALNCGADVVRVMTELRARHAQPDGVFWGIDGNTGKIVDMRILGVYFFLKDLINNKSKGLGIIGR